MSEIEKLYKNAGVGYLMYVVNTNPPVEYPQIDFTAEKQLELIKWLADSEGISIRYQEGKYIIYDAYSGTLYFDTLKEALAQFVNLLWQDLTTEEQEQIRSILNG